MNYNIKAFIKFGSEKNIIDLYNNGTVFLNTIQYFRNIEDGELRGDKYEGVSEVINSLPGTFKIKQSEQEFRFEKVHLRKSFKEILGNIYSLYAISDKGFRNYQDFKIDERLNGFGSYCLVIDPKSFINKMEKTLHNLGYSYNHGFVDYYDKEKICREVSLFEKPLEFEYQKEFRFFLKNEKIEPVKIQIDSLENCSELFRTEDILTLQLKPKELI